MKFTTDSLERWRQVGDPQGDAFFAQHKEQIRNWFKTIDTNLAIKNLPPGATPELPAWADPVLLRKGVSFFEANSKNILLMLGYLSLPYCYAAANGAKVLYSTGRIKIQTRKRLAETAQFVLDVCEPNSLASNGKARASAFKVRMIHAAIRHSLLAGGWDTQSYGVPVNQEDMAGTNLSFSFIILRGLRQSQVKFSTSEALAFIHLWNVISYLLGLDESLIPHTLEDAALLERLIAKRNFRPSPEGTELAEALMLCLEETSPFPKGFAVHYSRFLLGSVADLLKIPVPSEPNRLLPFIKLSNLLSWDTGDKEFESKVKTGIRELVGQLYPLPD